MPGGQRNNTRDNGRDSGFKGNKAALPSKPCLACGRPMSWRKAWARNWDAVRYCSDACRKNKPQSPDAAKAAKP